MNRVLTAFAFMALTSTPAWASSNFNRISGESAKALYIALDVPVERGRDDFKRPKNYKVGQTFRCSEANSLYECEFSGSFEVREGMSISIRYKNTRVTDQVAHFILEKTTVAVQSTRSDHERLDQKRFGNLVVSRQEHNNSSGREVSYVIVLETK